MLRSVIGDKPRRGSVRVRPRPDLFPKVFGSGGEQAINEEGQSQPETGRRSPHANIFNRLRQSSEHDRDRDHIGNGVAVLTRSQAIVLTRQPRYSHDDE